MKITAEFNSVEEVLNFTRTFGTTSFIPQQGESVQAPKAEVKKETISKSIEAPKADTEKKEIEQIHSSDDGKDQSEPQEDKNEEPKVTKEMVRERLGVIMKAGKQKEVKALVAKYGASKVPDIKEEDYSSVYKEAEGLL